MAVKTFQDMCREQREPIPAVIKTDLSGKTVVITGANVGLGFEAAKHFASMNPARLILACRSKEKGEKAMKEIEAAMGFGRLELRLIDLSKFASVVAFAEKFEQDGDKIDILVANAGVVSPNYTQTSDGWEETIQVNHLSTALMSLLLLPRLRAAISDGSNPRLVIVSSGVHFWSTFGPDVLSSPNVIEKLGSESYETKRYQDSKLLNVFFTRALASRLGAASSIIVNCLDPGYCTSELRRKSPKGATPDSNTLAEHTTEEGSRQLVWAAIGGVGRESELRGAYIAISDIEEPSDFVIGDEGAVAQKRVWDDTLEILSKISSRVPEIVEGL